MKNIIVTFCILVAVKAWSLEVSNFDTTSTGQKTPVMDLDDLRWSTHIDGEISAFDLDGNRLLYSFPEKRNWNFGGSTKTMTNLWTFKHKGLPDLYLSHTWTFSESGGLSVKIAQYDSVTRQGISNQAITGKVIREETFQIHDMMPVNWEYYKDKTQKIVVRFMPGVWTDGEKIELGRYPLNARKLVVYDSKGRIWARRVTTSEGNNFYFGLETGEGSIFISTLPFKGASEIGSVRRGIIQIKAGTDMTISMQSETPFVGEGIDAKIYGMVDLNRRVPGSKRLLVHGFDNESAMVSYIQQK